ncbi:MAG: hypothetical protein ACRDPW_07250, partial [Mycobacteriales bacterium]
VIELPKRFQLPTDIWATKYIELAKPLAEFGEYRTYDRAKPLITAFLDPVLAGDSIGIWLTDQHRWQFLA